MALRGTLTHRKTRRLATTLGIPCCFALGILEALWHTTAEQAPSGNIGRMSNQDIADEMFYDGDADVLINALIASGWLDTDSKCRLLVHDWSQHADQSVKRKVARHGSGFTSHDQSCPATPSSPVPEPEPEPEPEVVVSDSKGVQGEAQPDPVAVVRAPRFTRPSPEEVALYFVVLGMPRSEAGRYWDHYECNGWKVGKNPMKDWKAAARNWQRTFKERSNGKAPPRSATFDEMMGRMLGNE